MTTIAVFCALPPDRNTGMATVDLAAVSLLKRLAPEAEITLYAYGKPGPNAYREGQLPFHYRQVSDHKGPFFAADLIIFWGDFLHARSYWTVDQEGWGRQTMPFEDFAQYVFLTQLPPAALRKVIVYGSTLITNEARDHLDAAYYAQFTRLFSRAGAVLLRDALSAAKVSPLRGGEATLGCDCAFLLEDDDLRQVRGFTPAAERNGIGVFFGRSPDKGRMMLFSRLLGRALGQRCRWLPWFVWGRARRRDRWGYLAYGYAIRAADADTGAILSQLSGCRYIVTDTYHLCVNAWRMGIPAICIGEGARAADHSLGDKKKEVLYEMYGARRFYVYAESLRSLRGCFAEARRAAEVLADAAPADAVRATISDHQAMATRRLSAAIRTALG